MVGGAGRRLGDLGGAAAATDGWVTYTDTAHGVRIELPKAPKVETGTDTRQGVKLTLTDITAEVSDGFYGLAITDSEAAPQGEIWDLLHGSAMGSVEGIKATVLSEFRTQVDGLPAIEVIAERPKDRLHIHTLVVLRGATLFQAIALGTGAEPPGAVRFVRSLHFTDPLPG